MSTGESSSTPSGAHASVLMPSEAIPADALHIKGPNFNTPVTLQELLESYEKIGFQATGLAKAIKIVENMRQARQNTEEPLTLFLGYTSNLISSGLREIIKFLCEHKMIDVLVTTAGGIEEDFIKCLGSTVLGDFAMEGAGLRKRGLNRIGNLLVPNSNYCAFEDWVVPLLDKMLEEQEGTEKKHWTPSEVIRRLGKEINNEESVYYWCYKNDIPVFCPALTDGSLGDMLYFHSYKNPGFIIDIVGDIRRLNDLSIHAKKAGMIVLGGGVCKHQIANAMLFRNGADYAVYINTGQEFDGSDSGARPDEAVSWGKIRANAESVKVYADATLVFPLVVAATFGKSHWESQSQASQAKHSNGTHTS